MVTPRVNKHYPNFQGKLWVNRVKLQFTRVIANLEVKLKPNVASVISMGNAEFLFNISQKLIMNLHLAMAVATKNILHSIRVLKTVGKLVS